MQNNYKFVPPFFRDDISSMVENTMAHCRRDILWSRTLWSDNSEDDSSSRKKKKADDDSRDGVSMRIHSCVT